jgi:hypothetical protein
VSASRRQGGEALRITDELAGFLESGVAITVATRDDERQPDGAWAWAARVHEDRAHLTLFLHPEGAAAMLRNLEVHPEIAAVLDRPSDHRACQVKGVFEASRRARAEERPHVERQVDGFRADLETIGMSRGMTAAWKCWPCTAIRIRVTGLFEQAPGPGAGEPLR